MRWRASFFASIKMAVFRVSQWKRPTEGFSLTCVLDGGLPLECFGGRACESAGGDCGVGADHHSLTSFIHQGPRRRMKTVQCLDPLLHRMAENQRQLHPPLDFHWRLGNANCLTKQIGFHDWWFLGRMHVRMGLHDEEVDELQLVVVHQNLEERSMHLGQMVPARHLVDVPLVLNSVFLSLVVALQHKIGASHCCCSELMHRLPKSECDCEWVGKCWHLSAADGGLQLILSLQQKVLIARSIFSFISLAKFKRTIMY